MPIREVIDEQLKDVGKSRGLEIWRIEQFQLVPVPKAQYGNFYSGDSYVVLYTKNIGEWNVHFWLGSETSIIDEQLMKVQRDKIFEPVHRSMNKRTIVHIPDERGTAAIKTVELDDSLNGLPVQYRELQFHESSLFISYFKDGIRYLEGGTPTGFSHVEEMYKDWKPKLWRCKGKRNVRCTEVKCEFDSLNSGDVFILDCGLTLYVWMPLSSGRLERIKGMAQAKSIRDVERAGRPSIQVLDSDWNRNEKFWSCFGGCSKARELKPPDADGTDENFWRDNRRDVTLWKVSDESGNLKTTLVSKGNFKKDQLNSVDAFILDAGNGGVYVWIGKECTKNERARAMEIGTKFIDEKNISKNTQVVRVLEGAEPASFTQWSSTWHSAKKTQQYQPKLYQCSNESGRLLVEEIANFTQEDLDGDDVMILDALDVIYLWIGTGANVEEKKHAQVTAQKYLSTDSIPRTKMATVETIFQGEETPTFKKLFPEWNDTLWKSGVRSYENMRKLLFS